MPNLSVTLYNIQSFELAIDQARSRLDAIEMALANDVHVTAAQAALRDSETALHQTSAQVKNLELEISGLTQKINEVDKLLYSGEIQNPKELQERGEELDSLKRRQQNLEVQFLEAEDSLKTQQSTHDEANQTLKEAMAQRDHTNTDLLAERKQLEAVIHNSLKKRKEIMHVIPEDVLKEYRKLRKEHKNGQAIALIVGDSCSVCQIEQPTSEIQRILRADDFVYCVGCGRILANQ